MQYIQLGLVHLVSALCLTLCSTSAAVATDYLLQPFAIRNLNPFVGIYDIPAMQAPVTLPAGASAINLTLDASSHFTDNSSESESIQLDGETYRLAFRYTRGLRSNWEAGAEIPLIKHTGGILDGLINRWHDTFGLPTLGRDRVADNLLNFAYARDGRVAVDVGSSATGLGDILLFAGKSLGQDRAYHLTIRGQLKLPTGDAKRLTGSGGTDISLSAAFSRAWGDGWLWMARLGGAHIGSGEVLPELQRHWVGFGSLYLGWRPFRWLALKLQLDAQTPIYHDSDFHQLTDPASQLTLGGSVRLGASSFIDFGVTEDEINPDVSPDVSFQLRWRMLVGRG